MDLPATIYTSLLLLIFSTCKSQVADEYKFRREQMVKRQIEARGIYDHRVLNAMRKVERHMFVPHDQMSNAYGDYPLPIGCGQTISQPYIVAFMTEALHLKPDSKVLEIGTGSGYQAAILAELCDSVFTVEIFSELGQRARNLLKMLGYNNIMVKIGDGYQGWPEHAPYQAIIVTCAPTHVPAPLIKQLDEDGRMIIPVGEQFNQNLVVLIKKEGKLREEEVLPVRFVPMIDKNMKEY
jgi:protein-L-isoaspartate(D-aspartate) O-methyltransferase